jgi:hypothetical protein
MEALQVIRDLAIILLAVETIVVGAVLIVLVWQVWRLVGLVRHHIDQTMGKTSDILGTVRETAVVVADTAKQTKGTADFINDRTARPVIELYALITGVSRFARAVVRPAPKRLEPDGEEEA